ncbi:FAD:protein FMN transferase [Candidatus Pristimantibacillus sp. PTI5]|uniref:FAD:protein FMN transferase n=1 Tax=Candidatus Pristimantibacillus sp. PTI5 TaxID=3400422 RepID=UPI003B026767
MKTFEYRDNAEENNVSNFVFNFKAIGTHWEIETKKPLRYMLQQSILKRIEQYDVTYSRFRSDSLVSQVSAAPDGGNFEFPDDSVILFDLYDKLYTATDGAVDPLVGRELELLGYDQTYSLRPVTDHVRAKAHAEGRATWSKDIVRVGKSLVTRRPLVIDVGAAGKGYLVDIVSGLLHEAGFKEFIIDGGGDIRHSGEDITRIGLEHPYDPNQVIGVFNLKNRAICASAVNRRAWGDRLHHVIDARTGIPVRDVIATWVVADNAATADGLATALFFTGGDRLADLFRFSYVRMFEGGRVEISRNFDGELFT